MTMLDLVVTWTLRKKKSTKEIVEILIESTEELTISYPNIYRGLKKIELLGYIEGKWEGNKKMYEVTQKGKKLIEGIMKL